MRLFYIDLPARNNLTFAKISTIFARQNVANVELTASAGTIVNIAIRTKQNFRRPSGRLRISAGGRRLRSRSALCVACREGSRFPKFGFTAGRLEVKDARHLSAHRKRRRSRCRGCNRCLLRRALDRFDRATRRKAAPDREAFWRGASIFGGTFASRPISSANFIRAQRRKLCRRSKSP